MDMNRPVNEGLGSPKSSRSSNSKNRNANDSPEDENEPRTKSETQMFEESDELAQDSKHTEQETAQLNEMEPNPVDVDQQEEPSSHLGGEHNEETSKQDLVDESLLEETMDEEKRELNQSINVTQDGDTSILDTSQMSDLGDSSQIAEKETQEKKDELSEHVEQKKGVAKRKHKPNKFADGNLIPEEGDMDEFDKSKSPGPPPLEPISQILDDQDKHIGDRHPAKHDDLLRPTSPDKVDVTIEDDYQDVEIDAPPTREELIARYQSVIEERERLQNTNNQLHNKLADYLRRKKSEEPQNQQVVEKPNQDSEQRYLKYLSTIQTMKKQLEQDKIEAEAQLNDLKHQCENRERLVEQERSKFTKIKKDTALKSVTQSGRALTGKDAEAYLERERQKERDVISVRIENIKLKNQLNKREMEIKAKEEFGEGLHMIDFEQLKIENQTYNEKIEERNEELMKLKKKINNTVQLLTHVKEKLQFVNAQNETERNRLTELDEQVKKKRDASNKLKQSRDRLRLDNSRLKQSGGLLGNTSLLRDFEDCVDNNDHLEEEIEMLKRKHAELVLNSKGIRQKISQTKGDN